MSSDVFLATNNPLTIETGAAAPRSNGGESESTTNLDAFCFAEPTGSVLVADEDVVCAEGDDGADGVETVAVADATSNADAIVWTGAMDEALVCAVVEATAGTVVDPESLQPITEEAAMSSTSGVVCVLWCMRSLWNVMGCCHDA